MSPCVKGAWGLNVQATKRPGGPPLLGPRIWWLQDISGRYASASHRSSSSRLIIVSMCSQLPKPGSRRPVDSGPLRLASASSCCQPESCLAVKDKPPKFRSFLFDVVVSVSGDRRDVAFEHRGLLVGEVAVFVDDHLLEVIDRDRGVDVVLVQRVKLRAKSAKDIGRSSVPLTDGKKISDSAVAQGSSGEDGRQRRQVRAARWNRSP